jgi:tumor protein p53-inducible protein 3
MKAVVIENFGGPENLKIHEISAPKISAGKLRIKVAAAGVNRADLLQRRGLYPAPSGESTILGLEAAGIVTEVGPNSKFTLGDRVMALLSGGGYAEEVVVPETQVMPLEATLSDFEGAAIPEAFITAHLNLFQLGRAEMGERFLIHAGASGVGMAGIQLLRHFLNADVWTTVGSPEKAESCRQWGANPILYKQESFADVLLNQHPAGIDLILDCIGGSYFDPNVRALAVGGRLVVIGTMGGKNAALDLSNLLKRRLKIIGSALRTQPVDAKEKIVRTFSSACLPAFRSGELKANVDRVFKMEHAADAHRYMESNANTGKIILSWK